MPAALAGAAGGELRLRTALAAAQRERDDAAVGDVLRLAGYREPLRITPTSAP